MQIGTGSTSIRLTAKGMKRFFRTCPRDDEQGRVAQSTLAKFGFKKVAILHDNSAYAKGLADEAKQRILDKKSADIVFFDALVPGERDYSAILTKIKGVKPGRHPCSRATTPKRAAAAPDAGDEVGRAHHRRRRHQQHGSREDRRGRGRRVSVHFPDHARGHRHPDGQGVPQGVRGEVPQPAQLHLVRARRGTPYNVLIAAIKAKGPDPAAIAGYLHNDLKNLDCFTGQISFDEKGDRVGDLYRLYEVNAKGEFILQPK